MGALKGKKHSRDVRLNATNKLKKDPGVPDLSHFKKKQAKKEEERKKQIAKKQEKAAARRPGANMGSLQALMQNAQERDQQYETENKPAQDGPKELRDAALTGEKDNSKKAYLREFKKVLENADVVLEILDARDPLGTRTRSVERMIMDSGLNKKIILVLNKIDLVPKENIEKWLKYLRNEYPTISFKASTQSQRRNLGRHNVSADVATKDMLASSECVGAEALMSLLKNYCRNAHIKTSITVGIIGYPNVGKSSVINSLARSRVCGVGSTPGFTKVAQQITLDKNIKLLDCPGIVFATQGQDGQSDAEIALRNCIKVELLEDPVTPVEVILQRCGHQRLMDLYGVGFFNNAYEFLVLLGQQRGKLKKGGVPDVQLVARSVLIDWNSGKIPFFTDPPATTQGHIESSVVTSFAEALDVNNIIIPAADVNMDEDDLRHDIEEGEEMMEL